MRHWYDRARPRARRLAGGGLLVLILALIAPLANSAGATSPTLSAARDAASGFPLWYQDALSQRVEACLDANDAQCVLPAAGDEPNFDPAKTLDFPDNFPSEFFYALADANDIPTPGCEGTAPGRARLRLAVEGAFVNGAPAPADQMVFGRVRITVNSGLCPNTDYTFTQPYGSVTLTTNDVGAIPANVGTTDIGCVPAPGKKCDFSQALQSPLFQGFLHWPADPADPAPAGYLGDAATPHVVEGSPTGTNLFRVDGPGADGSPATLETNLFTVSGKLAGPLMASPTANDFGGVAAGSSATRVFTLTNVSPKPLAISALDFTGADAADFQATAGDCAAATLQQDQSCTVTVAFAPALAAAAGRHNATLVVSHDGVRSPLSIALTGTVTATGQAAQATLIPTALDFGNQRLGVFGNTKSVTVRNDGTAPLGITGATLNGPDAADFDVSNDRCTGKFLDNGQTCAITVSFVPNVIGARGLATTLDIASNTAGGISSVTLAGTGVGGVASVAQDQTFGFPNWYRDENGIRLAPCYEGTDPNCVLPAAGDEPNFDPAQPLSFPGPPLNFPSEFFYTVADSDRVVVGCNGRTDGRASVRVALEGAFTNGDPAANEQNIFGRVRFTGTKLCANRLYEFVTPYGVQQVSTDSTGTLRRNQATEDVGCFPVAPAVCDPRDALQSRVLSGFLRWDPNVVPKAPAGYIGDGATLHRVTGGSYVDETGATVNYFAIIDTVTGQQIARTSLWTVAGKLSGPLVANPGSVVFDAQDLASTSAGRNVTLTNEGSSPIAIATLALQGANADNFAIDQTDCAGTTLAPGANCQATLTFTPNDSGLRTANLVVTHDGLNSPTSVGLSGTGRIAPPALNVSPASLSYVQTRVGTTSGAQTVTVDNLGGGAALDVSDLSISGADAASFGIDTESCLTPLIQPGQSCSVQIVFHPTQAGSLSASLDVSGVDETGAPVPPKHVALSGTGFVGNAAVSQQVDASHGFPLYYQDGNGVRVEPCVDSTDAKCVLPGVEPNFDPAQPTSFPDNFPSEWFYALADSNPAAGAVPCGTQTKQATATVRLALEGSFATGVPVAGDQTTFARIRIKASGLCAGQLYQFRHPYGTETLQANSLGAVVFTEDIGCGGTPCLFDAPLASRVLDGFLRWDPAFGNAPAGYLGDALTPHRVLGSPSGTNSFAILSEDGQTTYGSSNLFTVMGKLAGPLMASPSSLDFGNQPVNSTSAARTVTIRNIGSAGIDVGAATVQGTAFAIAGDTCSNTTVASDGTCTIRLTFAPTALGPATGTLTLPHSGTNTPVTVDLAGTGAAPAASLDTTTLDFGNQIVGQASAARTVTVTNTGNAPLSVSGATVTGAGFAVSRNSCTTAVAPNGSCAIDVTFTPGARGAASGQLSITHNAAGSPSTVALSGNGVAPVASLGPAAGLAFGSVTSGSTSASQNAILSNSGDATLNISGITFGGTNAGDFARSGGTCGTTLAAGANCTIAVTFTPQATGPRSATLQVADNAAGSPQSIALSGTGTAPTAPGASLAPATGLAFGSVTTGTTSAAQTATLTNTGNAALTITSVTFGGTNAADFARSGGTCAATLAAGSSCTIDVTFRPGAAGTRSGTLVVADNAPSGTQSIALGGTGTAPTGTTATLSAPAAGTDFGSRAVGTTSGARNFTLRNTGTSALTITGVTFTGANTGDFARSGGTCATTLAAGSSCTIGVTFSPKASGARTATLNVADSATNSPQTLVLTGTGTAPSVSLGPVALAFGDQGVGTTSAAKTVTVTNGGNANLDITAVAISPTGQFAVSTQNCTVPLIAPGASCTISVTFRPTTAGAKTASLSITSNAPDSPHSVPLSGNGTTVTGQAPTVTAPAQALTQGLTLAQTTTANNVPVTISWSGTSTGSTIASYRLEESTNGGTTWTAVTLPTATTTSINRSLAPGTTTYQYRVQATDANGLTSTVAAGAPFQIAAVQDAPSTSLVYTGAWTATNLAGAYGGTLRQASAAGRIAALSFTGNRIAWVSSVGPNRGRANVFVDGVNVATIDLFAAAAANRRMVFTRSLTAGAHTIEVRPTGTRNASSTGTRVDVDAFVVGS